MGSSAPTKVCVHFLLIIRRKDSHRANLSILFEVTVISLVVYSINGRPNLGHFRTGNKVVQYHD